MNNNRAPMNDQNIRLAVSYALDRQTPFSRRSSPVRVEEHEPLVSIALGL